MSEGKLSLDLDRAAFLFMDFQRSIVQMARRPPRGRGSCSPRYAGRGGG